MRRLIFLDFLRGFFILLVLFIHAIANVAFGGENSAIGDVNPVVVAILSPILLIATWAPVFAFISGTANVYVLYHMMAKNPTNEVLKKNVAGIWINSAFVLLVSYLNMLLFHHSFELDGEIQYTLLSGLIERGQMIFYPDLLFYTDAMHIIAISGFIVSGVMYLLWRNGGFEKRRRNTMVLTGMAFLILITSPLLHNFLVPIYYSEIDQGHYITALIMKIFIAPRQSTLPNVANALIGAVIGLTLANNAPKKELKEFLISLGLLFIVIDVFLLLPEHMITAGNFTDHDLPITIYLLNIGLQILFFTLLIIKMEYPDYEARKKIAKRTTGVRRFGLLALTVYIFEGMLSDILGKLYIPLWGPGFVLKDSPLAMAIFVALDLGVWYLILRIWERWDFKYSIEWWLVFIVGRLRGRRSSRLRVGEVLYNPIDIPSEDLESTFGALFPSEALTQTSFDKLRENLTKTLDSIQEVSLKLRDNIIAQFETNFKIKKKIKEPEQPSKLKEPVRPEESTKSEERIKGLEELNKNPEK
jgi:hypothetical protein